MATNDIQNRITERNAAFAATNKDYQALAMGQKPDCVVVACSDSRVSPEIITGGKLGELFVIRTIGQALDDAAVASIEYPVAHLNVKNIVFMGHTECGAVKAALGMLNGDELHEKTLAKVVKGLATNLSKEDSIVDAVQKNTEKQAQELLKRSAVIMNAVKRGDVEISVRIYDIRTGKLSEPHRIAIREKSRL